MLTIRDQQMLNGYTIYPDNQNDAIFYVLPQAPSLRTGPDGGPILTFIKYRDLLDNGSGVLAGGFLMLDVGIEVPQADADAVKGQLQQQVNARYANSGSPPPQVTIGQVEWSKGSVSVHVLADDSTFVQKVTNPSSPSLYGDNTTSIAVELSDRGAALVQSALQAMGGVVQVVYNCFFWTALPKVHGDAYFYAEKFYSFAQTIQIDSDVWGEDSYQETMSETFYNSGSMGVELSSGEGVDQSTLDTIRSALQKDLAEWVKESMQDQIKAVDPSQTGDRGDDYLSRNFTQTHIDSYYETFDQNQVIEQPANPNGGIVLAGMKLKDGTPVDPNKYIIQANLNDPWFATQRVFISAPVRWDDTTKIDSVDVTITYGTSPAQSFPLSKAQTTGKFEQFKINPDGSHNGDEWMWSATVNYTDQDKPYKIPPTSTTGTVLEVDEALAGLLDVQIQPGNILWDKVASAQVTVHYETSTGPIEETFTLTKDSPTARWSEVLFERWDKPYRFKVMYTMADGTTYHRDWTEVPGQNQMLQANSPFAATRLITIRAIGDLANDIDSIDLSVSYQDPANNYQVQQVVSLSKATPFTTWPIQVIDVNAGAVTYSGMIRRRNGATDDIALTTVTGNLIEVGDRFADVLTVQFDASLVDWNIVALVKAVVTYADPADGINRTYDDVIHPNTAPAPIVIELKDAIKRSYAWQATFYLKDGTQKQTAAVTTEDLAPILQLPA